MKQLKRTQVHRLPSNDENISLLSKRIKDGVLQSATTSHGVANCNPLWIPQHLYFTTDEEIEKKFPQIVMEKLIDGTHSLFQIDNANDIDVKTQRKIIASTDPKLDSLKECPIRGGVSNVKYIFPKIPQDFIKDYCKQGGIDEVYVEYELQSISEQIFNPFLGKEEWKQREALKLKVDPIHNTITTHLIEEKMYSLDVVRKAYLAGWVRGDLEIPGNPNEWIKENL
jgi:hypothetical protein